MNSGKGRKGLELMERKVMKVEKWSVKIFCLNFMIKSSEFMD